MVFKKLRPGDTIGVFSPSSYVEEKDLISGIKFFEEAGYKLLIHPQTYERYNQSAGTHEQKLQAFYELYQNPDVKMIIAARGGNRCLHLMDQIKFATLKVHPKPLIGYSDLTALLNAMWVNTAHIQVHGPVLKELGHKEKAEKLLDFLTSGKISYDLSQSKVIKNGTARGHLFGGNLSLFHHMIGMEYMPDLHGAILILEDIGEELSRIDRTLCHLRQLGIFKQLGGLVFGEMVDMRDSGNTPFGFSLEEIILEHTSDLNIPVIMNAPFGHGQDNYPLPIGQEVNFEASAGDCRIFST